MSQNNPSPKADAETSPSQASQFEQLGQEQPESLIAEFVIFLTENKKWWMVPILLVLGLLGALAVATTTGATPFIYTLF